MVEVMDDTDSCSSRASVAWPAAAMNLKRRQKVEVFHDVVRRLRESECEEASLPGFEDELWAHFNRLPVRYALDVNVERAEDVLMHKRLLRMAHDPTTRPAIDVRLGQVPPIADENDGDSVHSNVTRKRDAQDSDYLGRHNVHPPPAFGLSAGFELALEANKSHVKQGSSDMSANQHLFRSLHEITISTIDKPKLLSKNHSEPVGEFISNWIDNYGHEPVLTSLLSEIGLNIQEAHAFSTTDGYSLDVFVVGGWEYEETEKLRSALAKEIPKIEKKSWSKHDFVSPSEELGQLEITRIPECVEISMDKVDVWEIDPRMLNFDQKVASGSYGDLYKGTLHSQDVAIKVLKVEYLNDHVQKEFAQEVYILRKVRHKNVVQFIGACTKAPNLCIVTEFMAGGSVYDFLHKQKGHFKLPALLKVAIDVSKGMNYLHQNNIVHRDLKAANLLMDENEVVKVADFGVARVQTQTGVMTAETGTYRWMAPEVIEHRPYSHKADIFSFGIVLWELLTGKLPYADFTPLQAAVGVVQQGLRPKIPRLTHPKIVELLERCWQQEPFLRPEFSEIIEILQHLSTTAVDEERSNKRRIHLGKVPKTEET